VKFGDESKMRPRFPDWEISDEDFRFVVTRRSMSEGERTEESIG